MTRRKFRFGIAGRAQTRTAWQDFARQAEDLGFSTLLIPDHFTSQMAPLPAIVSVAAVTSRLRFGTNVLDNDFRHPAVLAKEAATVDLLTDGRFELGVGAGWSPSDYSQTGIPFDTGNVRFERLKEAVHIITAAFGPEPVSFSGKYYAVQELNVLPKPVQKPGPPLLLGASRPRMLAYAGQVADIVGLEDQQWPQRDLHANHIPVANAAEQVAIVREAAGARFDQIELSILLARIVITDRPHEAAESMAANLGLSVEQVLGSASILIGSVDSMIEQLQERRERLGISYPVVFDRAALEAGFSRVVARLTAI
ncbi:MAG: TIGR03621 family F420-dependent LLM class oxidoreductase [Chloroflexi bacterium]|nr:MAG: TIGR03621 family F420-dependent LLM class oxidoreductase [Chloroflexota bacterium]